VAYSIHPDSTGFWRDHLTRQGIAIEEKTRFGAPLLAFADPDGMALELVANEGKASFQVWEDGPIPAQHVLRGFHGVTLWLDEIEPTARLLTEQMGYTFAGQEGARYRYQGASGDIGLNVDLLHKPGLSRGSLGRGSVHHIAFRTVDDSEQLEYQSRLRQAGLHVTPVQDRQYFHSIYFREPGGVLFEIATLGPGFLYDEPVTELGSGLKLPPWYEPNRAEIEHILPPLQRKPVLKAEASFD
jgi:glyoxalase family protein